MCHLRHDYSVGFSELNECQDYADAAGKLYEIEQATRQLVKLLYTEGKFDVAMIDDAIGRICDAVDIDMPAHTPRIQEKQSYYFSLGIDSLNAVNQ